MKKSLTAGCAFVSAMVFSCCNIAAAKESPALPNDAFLKAEQQPVHSEKKQRGKASVYAQKFAHQRMADGTRFDLESNSAASLTLPLGSHARVTNLRNGRSIEVVIRDRGPFVKGRIVDLSPHSARQLGFSGLASVEVERIVPVRHTQGGAHGVPVMLAWDNRARLMAKACICPAAPGVPPPFFQDDLPVD